MTTVRRLLQTKGNQVWTVTPEETIGVALARLAEQNIGALLVCEGPTLVGIVSERDFARRVNRESKIDLEQPVSQFMTREVVSIGPDQSIEECMALMTRGHFRHLPVLENGQLTGMISIGDVVKEIISDQEFVIKNLENYIVGKK